MTEIKIDKNIPLPAKTANGKYPFGKLEIGESFFIPGLRSDQLGGFPGCHRPKKFSARTLTENGIKGVRVWRIA